MQDKWSIRDVADTLAKHGLIVELCRDAISRQAVLNKILKFSVTDGRSVSVSGLWTEVNDLPSVTPQEPTTKNDLGVDAVSRQAVLDEAFEVDTKEYGRIDVVGVDAIVALSPIILQPKTGHCKDCKWWRDSDGLYRRGSHAESQCPINRREVFEGNGYCYMFEPQERSE